MKIGNKYLVKVAEKLMLWSWPKNKVAFAQKLLFWSWNLVFLAFVNLGIMPIVGSDLLYGLYMGQVNADFIAFFLVLLAVPVASVAAGFFFIKGNSKKLFALMYCIELPLLILTLLRVFLLRDLNGGTTFFLTLFIASSAYFAYRLNFLKNAGSLANVAGATMFFSCGAWIAMMISFLVPPFAYLVGRGLFNFLENLWRFVSFDMFTSMYGVFFLGAGTVFVAYTATLFILFPIVYVVTSYRNWREALRANGGERERRAIGVALATFGAVAIAFFSTTEQTHVKTLADLRRLAGTDDGRKEIAAKESHYRRALRDIYLAPYRYLGDQHRVNFIQHLYRDVFGADYLAMEPVQKLFNTVARPFIYVGTPGGMAEDQRSAEVWYTDILDGSIHEDENESIRHALQSTYSREQVEAGLVNINQKQVHLEKQELTIREQGEWADVELHEVYHNPKLRSEEVFLHLKLPPGSVINGVWLSDDDTVKKYPAAVSPRGAAQKVYKQIVARGEDPALVEQVGPQFYRLRVFPILPNPRYGKKKVTHLWLSLRVLRQDAAFWRLPVLTERRNLYWDGSTEYSLNGVKSRKGEEWLPARVPATAASEPRAVTTTVDGRAITMEPRGDTASTAECSLAVIVDTSFSMGRRRQAIVSAREAIDKSCNGRGVEYFLWSGGPVPVEGDFKTRIEKHLFWGTLDTSILARDLLPASSGTAAVVVLTDKSFFREKTEKLEYSKLQHPAWFLLLDGEYSRSVDDNLLKRLYEVGGGVETRWDDLFQAYARHQYKAERPDVLDVDGRYVWKTSPGKGAAPGGPVEPVLAHKLIVHDVSRGKTRELAQLDRLQKIALQAGIVSPYSSMIVLVDDEQKKMLKDAEKDKDRFDRQTETGKEMLTPPSSPFEVKAVPEPEEWALLFLAGCFLIFHLRRRGFNLGAIYGTMYR